ITGDYVLLFYAIKNLLTAYHIDKSSTGKIIEPVLAIFQIVQQNKFHWLPRKLSLAVVIQSFFGIIL
ncbi:hypothetical protein, partial [Lactobacillus helveticus]|uniref:hypothetical protein n=1 Tax=Lactobacillus helveticus TaxID=1587 RepID=UPI0021824E8F